MSDAYGVAMSWLREPRRARLAQAGRNTPGARRLVAGCLAPLLNEILDPTPLATFEVRAHQLLTAAQPALSSDLVTVEADVEELLDTIQQQLAGVPVRGALPASAIQDRIALALRTMMQPAWRATTDPAGTPIAPFTPVWHGPPPQLEESLRELALLRRCAWWTSSQGSARKLDFARRWRAEVDDLVARTDPGLLAPSSVALGLGERPVPHIVMDPAVPRDWRLATDRSFYNRVHLYWDSTHVRRPLASESPTATSPDLRFETHPTPGQALIRESNARTVSALGLFDPAHRWLLEVAGPAIGAAADNPWQRVPDAGRVADAWEALPHEPDESDSTGMGRAIQALAGAWLRGRKVSPGMLDSPRYTQYVLRRLWVCLHAFEVTGARITGASLAGEIKAVVDNSRSATGVWRTMTEPVRPEDHRARNTWRVVGSIIEDLPDLAPGDGSDIDWDAVVREYRTRYPALKGDPQIRKRGGLYRPDWVERRIEFRDEDDL